MRSSLAVLLIFGFFGNLLTSPVYAETNQNEASTADAGAALPPKTTRTTRVIREEYGAPVLMPEEHFKLIEAKNENDEYVKLSKESLVFDKDEKYVSSRLYFQSTLKVFS